uniref:GRF-type domain-containing protein n=1 Tax=Ananas comosus var. bracteatus TaxID=296719 RepID=A0A6V7PM56_ANACO|nr:unnamed protein product [Ananas comosus var. bracteatus]
MNRRKSMGYIQSHVILCYCGNEAVVKISRTSANPGRPFYSCSKYNKKTSGNYCQFFRWCDSDLNISEKGYSEVTSEGSTSTGIQTDDSLNNINFLAIRDELKELKIKTERRIFKIKLYLVVLFVFVAMMYVKILM